jgi:putative ABC transport system permease protein
MPLDRLNLYGHWFRNGEPQGGRIRFIWLFGIIGVFVLFLACINFMNLSTARSEKRAKEVGIRKTIGSLRTQLIGQFLGESVLIAFLSLILALLLVITTLPFFNQLTVKTMAVPWTNPLFDLSLIAFTLLTGILAGSYPAFYLSGFRAVKVLKGAFKAGRGASIPRQALVVLQFSVSLILIIGTVIVYRQIQFTKDRPTGYDRDRLVTVGINTTELQTHDKALIADLLRSGVVDKAAESSQSTTMFGNNNDVDWEGKDPSLSMVFFRNISVTPEFGQTVGWHVLQGRDFSRSFATDSNAVILNDTAAKIIGFKDPIGKTVTFWGKRRTVIGVVQNMVTNSPYEPVEPAIFLGEGWVGVITMHLRAGLPTHEAIAAIAPLFAKYNPGSPFLYRFNDDEYNRKFEGEERIGNLATVFAGLAIFISCLGLFGLAAFVAEQRTKEIGVRKVLGAGVVSLWGLLSKEFLRLVALSLLISLPVAWLAMDRWLQIYPYHAPLSWWIFAFAAIGILLITLLTVSYQSLRAATANPVKSLRAE